MVELNRVWIRSCVDDLGCARVWAGLDEGCSSSLYAATYELINCSRGSSGENGYSIQGRLDSVGIVQVECTNESCIGKAPHTASATSAHNAVPRYITVTC